MQRQYLEAQIRAEVAAAYRQYEAARSAVRMYEFGVIQRSDANLRTIRAAYEAGAFNISDYLNEKRRAIEAKNEFTTDLAK